MNPAADTGIDYSTDYCFCMWKIDEANSSSEHSFSVSNCYASFELPRSAPYDPDDLGTQYYSNISGNSLSVTTTGTTNQSVKKYINITMGGNTYRAYLNGDEVLVAYEFVAKEEGIYLLGSTKECRIVFFSADATASAGNDGITSYRLGTIDFVYDNSVDGSTASQILTTELIDTDGNNTYDYASHYYPTLCLLSTDNDHSSADLLSDDTDISSRTISGITIQYANINDFSIYVRRRRSSTAAVIDWHVTGGTQLQNGIADAAYIKFVSYSLDSDILNRALDALRIIP